MLLLIAVVGIVIFAGDRQAHHDADRIRCIETQHATAAIAAIVPVNRVDEQGRLDAVKTLGSQLANC